MYIYIHTPTHILSKYLLGVSAKLFIAFPLVSFNGWPRGVGASQVFGPKNKKFAQQYMYYIRTRFLPIFYTYIHASCTVKRDRCKLVFVYCAVKEHVYVSFDGERGRRLLSGNHFLSPSTLPHCALSPSVF